MAHLSNCRRLEAVDHPAGGASREGRFTDAGTVSISSGSDAEKSGWTAGSSRANARVPAQDEGGRGNRSPFARIDEEGRDVQATVGGLGNLLCSVSNLLNGSALPPQSVTSC